MEAPLDSYRPCKDTCTWRGEAARILCLVLPSPLLPSLSAPLHPSLNYSLSLFVPSLPLLLPPFPPSLSLPTAYVHPTGTPLQAWTMEEVGDFLAALGYEAYLDRFVEHEIDGKALSLVKDHHLLMTLKLRLGPTLKICEHVNAIKAMEESVDEG